MVSFFVGSINLEGLKEKIDWEQLMGLDKYYCEADMEENKNFLKHQCGSDWPKAIKDEVFEQIERIETMFKYE